MFVAVPAIEVLVHLSILMRFFVNSLVKDISRQNYNFKIFYKLKNITSLCE